MLSAGGSSPRPYATLDRLRSTSGFLVDVAVGLLVLGFMLWRLPQSAADRTWTPWVVIMGTALAAGLSRRRPAWALVLVWALSILQIAAEHVVLGVEVGLPFVAYRTARYGSRATVWAAGLSIPVGAVVAVVLVLAHPGAFGEPASVALLRDLIRGSGLTVVSASLVMVAVLAAPFALGLVVRINERFRRSTVDRELAEAQAAAEHDLARSRAMQTKLARDVHDVVGHSLAVIIAQADAAHLVARDVDEPVRTALEHIAAVGRSSLAEVRDVLSRTDDSAPADQQSVELADLSRLVAGVRAAGNTVDDVSTGTPVELDSATAATAYRVLQELLTNSLKHGAPGGSIEVAQVWTPDGLTVRVGNPTTEAPVGPDGMGLSGVRTRLDAVGGTFRTAVSQRNECAHFAATAFLPAGKMATAFHRAGTR